MTIVSADFAYRQDRYTGWRLFIRDVLLRGLAFRVLAQVHSEGLANIPMEGPTVLMYNHIDTIDPVVVIGAVAIRFAVPMSKIENFSLPVFGGLIKRWGAYPVRRGQVDRSAVQNTIDLLRQGHLVLISPEGTRQPALIKAKDGMAFAATRTGAMIVPVGIDGTPDLLRNLKRLRRTPIRLRFGRPFRFCVSGPVPRSQLGQLTDAAMVQLAALLPIHRRGYYENLAHLSTDSLEFV